MAYFCNGKQGICDHPEHGCMDCKYLDGSGGHKTATITNADHIRGMSDNEMARELIPLFEEIFEDGIPSPEWFNHWLQQPYKENEDEKAL